MCVDSVDYFHCYCLAEWMDWLHRDNWTNRQYRHSRDEWRRREGRGLLSKLRSCRRGEHEGPRKRQGLQYSHPRCHLSDRSAPTLARRAGRKWSKIRRPSGERSKWKTIGTSLRLFIHFCEKRRKIMIHCFFIFFRTGACYWKKKYLAARTNTAKAKCC